MNYDLVDTCIQRQIDALVEIFDVVRTAEYLLILGAVVDVAKSKNGRRVILAGVGKNSNIASKISQTMASLGIPSMAINVSHLGHGDYGFIGESDVIIHISRSGMTREMLEGIEHIDLLFPRVRQYLIHCKKGKPLNEHCAGELLLPNVLEGDEHTLAPTTSTTALLCVLDCLSVQASHEIGFQRLDFLKFHPDGALGAMLKSEQSKTIQIDPAASRIGNPDTVLHVKNKVLDKPEPGQEFA